MAYDEKLAHRIRELLAGEQLVVTEKRMFGGLAFLVGGLDREPEDRAIVEAVIGMARALGLTTIAEGVETESQAETLQKLGCPWAQGFYFTRPISAPHAAEFAADPSRLAASSSSVTRPDRLQAEAS